MVKTRQRFRGVEVLSLAATDYGSKTLIVLHPAGDYQDFAYCVKVN